MITKVEEQKHNRVKGRVAAGVALDEQAKMQVVVMQGDSASVVDDQQHDSEEGRIAAGVTIDKQDVGGAKDAVTDDHHVDKAKSNVFHVQDDAANGGIVDRQQDVSALAGLIVEDQPNSILKGGLSAKKMKDGCHLGERNKKKELHRLPSSSRRLVNA